MMTSAIDDRGKKASNHNTAFAFNANPNSHSNTRANGNTTNAANILSSSASNHSHKLESPRSVHHDKHSSITLESNPFASSQSNANNIQTNNAQSHLSTTGMLSATSLEDILQGYDPDKIEMNVDGDDNASLSYSFDAIQDDNAVDFSPPGYHIASQKNTIRRSKAAPRNTAIDSDDEYGRRTSNRKEIWRQMMQTVIDGIGNLGDLKTNMDDDDNNEYPKTANIYRQISVFNDEDDEEEEKYGGSRTQHKYKHIVQNTRLFRHNGYGIDRRFTSHEVLRSRYDCKRIRRKNRARSKSNPDLLPHTKRMHRKLEHEYRPGTMNLFLMKSNRRKKTEAPMVPTRSHQESVAFRFIFDDSDFGDDSDLCAHNHDVCTNVEPDVNSLSESHTSTPQTSPKTCTTNNNCKEWSEEDLDSLLRTYDLDVTDANAEFKNDSADTSETTLNGPNSNSPKMNKFKSLRVLQDVSKSLPGKFEKGIDKIKAVSSSNLGNNKVPLKPYGGHVEASVNAIEEEFGSIQHIKQYNVKKRNKLGRDKNRKAVLDITLQVLRMKDTNDKTHREHIVSSISDHALVGDESAATQIIIKFHDNRDYFLTFESNAECIEFRNLLEKLRKFNLKMLTNRPGGIRNNGMHKNTIQPSMRVSHASNHMNGARDARASSVSNSFKPGNTTNHTARTLMLSTTNEANTGFFDDDDEQSMSQSTHPTQGQVISLTASRPAAAGRNKRVRPRFDTDIFEAAVDDGNVYTGEETSNVVYRITKINKWGTKKERTMIVHKLDRTVRLFDDKRRCHSEYPLKIMATLDIIDSLNVEVVFTLDQKPTQFVFRSPVDMWDFVEQIRTIAPLIMVNDRRMKNYKKATIAAKTRDGFSKKRPRATTKDMLNLENNASGGDLNLETKDDEENMAFDEDLDINPNVLRYSVLRLIRSQARVRGAANQQVTWRQHRRCIYLDLEKQIVRMLTLGMHIKDYKFEDVLLLEKSYINVNQLHMTCKHKTKIKDYWYEFVSPQSRAEFVGRLLRALPGTKQSHSPLIGKQKARSAMKASNGDTPQLSIAPDASGISTETNLSPRPRKKNKRRKRLSSEALRGLMPPTENDNKSQSAPAPASNQVVPINANSGSSENNSSSNLDVNGLEDLHYSPTPTPEPNGNVLYMPTLTDSASDNPKNIRFTEDPLSIIVGSWNVSESEINYANLQMWIPPSKIEPHDIYVIGLQECAQGLRKQWASGILRHIDSGRKEYVLLNKAWLMGIGIIIIVHRAHVCKILHLHSQVVPTGKGNIIGNKGATAISFQFQETSFVFINAHLAARAEKFEKRAKNFNRIIKNLELGRPGLDVLHQFTHTFFLGDLNYRIEKDFYETVNLVKTKKWNELIKSDQLRDQMNKNHVFYGFKEGEINFCPTYRWERNKNTISNKREQPPSYCDRILYKSLPQTYDLWQECYLSSHRCFGSDHRPVWSLFKFKPKMPYFTSSAHDSTVAEMQDGEFKHSNHTNISISLLELQASFRGLLPSVSTSSADTTGSGASTGNKFSDSHKIQMHIDDEIDIILHYNYAAKPIRVKGGKYDYTTKGWRWPLEMLDALRIRPFIPDPEFICRTHIFVCFVNVSKGNLCIGYAIISLFNAFPHSLVDTKKLVKQYKSIAKQMNLMPSVNHEVALNDHLDENIKKQFLNNTASGNQQFDIPISLYGNRIGNLSGFVYADGTVVDTHRKKETVDFITNYEKTHTQQPDTQQQQGRQSTTGKLMNNTSNLWHRASAFINTKKT